MNYLLLYTFFLGFNQTHRAVHGSSAVGADERTRSSAVGRWPPRLPCRAKVVTPDGWGGGGGGVEAQTPSGARRKYRSPTGWLAEHLARAGNGLPACMPPCRPAACLEDPSPLWPDSWGLAGGCCCRCGQSRPHSVAFSSHIRRLLVRDRVRLVRRSGWVDKKRPNRPFPFFFFCATASGNLDAVRRARR